MAGVDTVANILDTIVFVVKWFWWVFILGWLITMKMRWKNWPIEAVIVEKRGSNLVKTNDRVGKYKDPFTGLLGYKLLKAKDTIPVPEFDWILHNAYRPTNIFEKFVSILRGNVGTIFLYRYGSKQYKPINLREGNGKMEWQEIKDKEGNPIMTQIYVPIDLRTPLVPIEFEVVDWDNMNFLVQEMQTTSLRRQKKAQWLWNIAIPLGMAVVTTLLCIIMIKFGYDYATDLRTSAPSAAQEATQPATVPDIPLISDVVPAT